MSRTALTKHSAICNIDSLTGACTVDHSKAVCQFCYGLNDPALGVGHTFSDHPVTHATVTTLVPRELVEDQMAQLLSSGWWDSWLTPEERSARDRESARQSARLVNRLRVFRYEISWRVHHAADALIRGRCAAQDDDLTEGRELR